MKYYLSAFACVAMATLGSVPANAEVITTAANPSLCLDVNASNNQVILWSCHGGANQNFFTAAYGQQRYNNLCLDFEGVGNTAQGAGLQMRGCDGNKRSQRWLLVSDPRDQNVGRLRNEEGFCVNILGGDGNARANTRPGAWTCQTGAARNDIWARGGFGSSGNAGLSAAVQQQFASAGAVMIKNPAGIVAAGGGNIVAAGGGNIVAAGGGNVITTSGGAIVAAGGGNIVAAGGGNLGPALNGAALTDLSRIGLGNAAGVMVHVGPN